ncbi:hypothetical protein [Burkholderia sp. S-53]|uniref:hypothetical protein n=1 Tax=Burkholderia sp. S-53 TaxID=2906514 RepID=UPI0021D16C6D|nr:hypothetical protein [Burkholderia sp. S-53]UXU89000.1 hypothetical protein LXM88_11230 [Burkholderia sp. S-53]
MLRKPLLTVMSASVFLAACGGDDATSTPGIAPTNTAAVPNTATASGYTLSVFAKAPTSTDKPDSIVQFNNTVFIGYQKAGDVKDGSVPGLTNDIVQYDLSGNVLKTYTVPGHVDGLMARADTNTLWAMANEDGNPELTIIDLKAGTQKTYAATVNPTVHGGGFDDMQLLNGNVYVSASNPTTPGTAAPTVGQLTLNANGTTFDVAPVLAGNAQATDVTPSVGGSSNPTFNQQVTLSLTDPDSEAIDSAGDLVLDSQADGKLVFIHNPGASQTVSVLTLTLFSDKDGPVYPVDDTRWVPAPGPQGKTFMLFTDASNTTYRVDAPFAQGDAYSAGQGQVMKLDMKSGHLTPVATSVGNASALQDPHGMLFVAL